MSVKLHVLTIDPQWDFCNPAGALYVPGAEKDIACGAKMMNKLMPAISDHHVIDRKGNHPQPFTKITYAQGLRRSVLASLSPSPRQMVEVHL